MAFVNRNHNQSAIFIDNVSVQREVLYQLAFDYEERVVDVKEQTISGKITIKKSGVSNISLTLQNSEGNAISTQSWTGITSDVKDRPIPFSFSTPLPLSVGSVNDYSITIAIDDRTDTYHGTITDLSFMPVKRVVLEEMTGIDCQNCPQGIVAIEKMQKTFGDRFIPISIHTYTSDPYESGLTAYSTFLGLGGAPSARINRVPGIYYPMVNKSGTFYMNDTDSPLWQDVVSEQLDRPALCDFSVRAANEGTSIRLDADVRYAITADNQQLSLLFVVLEDSLVNYQMNAFGTIEQSIFGEWGAQGIYSGENSNGIAYPVVHNDVARSVIGLGMSGTIGLFPSTLESGKTYTVNFSSAFPESIEDYKKASVVAMLIDTQNGEVINAAKSPILGESSAISTIKGDTDSQTYYDLQGRRIVTPTRGVYIKGGKKVFVK